MTFEEFKDNAYKLGWIWSSNPQEDAMRTLYYTWIIKTWCSEIKTKKIVWTRENEFLNLRELNVEDIEAIHKMNEILFKYQKAQQKEIALREDFI